MKRTAGGTGTNPGTVKSGCRFNRLSHENIRSLQAPTSCPPSVHVPLSLWPDAGRHGSDIDMEFTHTEPTDRLQRDEGQEIRNVPINACLSFIVGDGGIGLSDQMKRVSTKKVSPCG